MKDKTKKKRYWGSALFVIFIGVLVFTPLGTEIFILVNKIVAGSPGLEKTSDYKKVDFSDWNLLDETGETVRFIDFEGKIVLVNFWATWCPPCVAEKPSFQKLYNDYKDKIVFIFTTTDSSEKVNKYKEKNSYTFPVYYTISDPPEALQSNFIPTSFLIDKSGNIVVKETRAANWNSDKFRAILDELLK